VAESRGRVVGAYLQERDERVERRGVACTELGDVVQYGGPRHDVRRKRGIEESLLCKQKAQWVS
jgi:hypothetical protein